MTSLSSGQKIALVLFLALVFAGSFRALNQSDNFYHLKAGQVVWETKSVPTADVFSYSAAGARWVTHEWLAELIFYFVFAATGFWGLIAFASALAAITYFLLLKTAAQSGANLYAALLVAGITGIFTFQLWTVRPQIFSFLAVAILLALLENYRRNPKLRYLVGAAILLWIWANMHAAFILGIAIMLFYGISEFLRSRYPQYFGAGTLNSAQSSAIIKFAVLGTFLSLFNPNGYHIFLYSFAINPVVNALKFYEWQPITAYLAEAEIKAILAEILIFAALAILCFGARKETRDSTRFGLVLGVSVMPFLSVRHNGFWSIVILIPAALILSKFIALRPKFNATLRNITLAFIIAALPSALLHLPQKYFNPDFVPVYAADFIEKTSLRGPFFNLVNEGGYLIWRFWPRERVFMDSRSEVYVGSPIEELRTIVSGAQPEKWHELVDKKYAINYFILPYRPRIAGERPAGALPQTLMQNNWALMYWDDVVLIFVRNNPENQALIQKYGLRHISPFRDPKNILPEEYAETRSELQKISAVAPESRIIKEYEKMFFDLLNSLEK